MAVLAFPSGRMVARLAEPQNALITRRVVTDTIVSTDDPLARVWEAWRALRGDSKTPPLRQKLIPEDHLRPIMGYAHIIDCTAGDPLNYQFRLFGSRVELFRGASFTRRRLADLPDVELARHTASDYYNVITKGCPAVDQIRTRIDGKRADYARLLLPLTEMVNGQRQTTQLLVCINPRPLPELGELPW